MRVAAFGLLLAGGAMAAAQSVTPVPQLDLKQLTGAWYEVDHYASKAEKKCLGEPTILYALGDKTDSFSVVRACPAKDDFIDVKNLAGRKADASGDGRLKRRTLWPFWAKYSVIALAPDYGWALLGTRNHKSLWVISRTQTIDPAVLAQIKAKAASEGFDPQKLVMTPQLLGRSNTPAQAGQ